MEPLVHITGPETDLIDLQSDLLSEVAQRNSAGEDLQLEFETELAEGGLLDDSPLRQVPLADMAIFLGGAVTAIATNVISDLISELIKNKYPTLTARKPPEKKSGTNDFPPPRW